MALAMPSPPSLSALKRRERRAPLAPNSVISLISQQGGQIFCHLKRGQTNLGGGGIIEAEDSFADAGDGLALDL